MKITINILHPWVAFKADVIATDTFYLHTFCYMDILDRSVRMEPR
jgi:hypothetical protein